MLINLSNHPSDKWMPEQIKTAEKLYGKVTDISFPFVDPKASPDDIAQLSKVYLDKIVEISNGLKNFSVHIQGEFTLAFKLVTLLKDKEINCIASTARRNVTERGNGEKIIKFEFVQFRNY
jgi:hypothetical protein